MPFFSSLARLRYAKRALHYSLKSPTSPMKSPNIALKMRPTHTFAVHTVPPRGSLVSFRLSLAFEWADA